MSKTKILVITNLQGRIIAAARTAKLQTKGMNTAIYPLFGQTIHEVSVPDAALRLNAQDMHKFLSDHHLVDGELQKRHGEVIFRNVHDKEPRSKK